MSKPVFNEDKYIKAKKQGLKGNKLAKKLGYSSQPALSRAKREYLKKVGKETLVETVSVIEKIQKQVKEKPEQVDAELLDNEEENNSKLQEKKSTAMEGQVQDIISLLEDYLRKIIERTPPEFLEANDRVKVINSISNTLSRFTETMVKLGANK